jgi:hypothetical protein
LVVHHRRYAETPGEETVDDLTTLCQQCHGAIETVIRRRGYGERRAEEVKRLLSSKRPPRPKVARKGQRSDILPQLPELLEYDAGTGKLSWKVSRSNKIKVGQEAGSTNSLGYRIVSISRFYCYTHHIVWYLHHGEWPPNEIDHIDRDPSNNRIENLRLATRAQNNRNVHKGRLNKFGYTGVYALGPDRFQAKISIGRKMVYLGSFETKEDAARAYNKAAVMYRGEFACLNDVPDS